MGFVGDAISPSGLTGTELKCDVIGSYYPFWWKITSGGKNLQYEKPRAIVELYAATGEDISRILVKQFSILEAMH